MPTIKRVIFITILAASLIGCGKRKQYQTPEQERANIEALRAEQAELYKRTQ